MIKKILINTLNIFLNNNVVLKLFFNKIKNISFNNYDFLNFTFDDHEELKKIIFSKKYFLKKGIDVVCPGLDQDSRGHPWETSSFLLALADKITKIYGFCNVCGMEATKTFRKIEGGKRTQVGAADIYEPRCLKHWEPR